MDRNDYLNGLHPFSDTHIRPLIGTVIQQEYTICPSEVGFSYAPEPGKDM